MSELTNTLKALRERASLTFQDMADGLKLARASSYQYYENAGKSGFQGKVLPAKFYDAMLKLLVGRGDPSISKAEVDQLFHVGPKRGAATVVRDEEEYVDVPSFDVRAAAGAGAFVDDGVPVVYEKFRLGYLESLAPGRLSDLSLIRVSGDSMEDTLRTGDQILVDRSVRKWMGDGIYVILLDGVLQVKRLQHDDAGAIVIRSDNPKYEPIRPKKGLHFEVIGQVIWQSRALR